MYVGDVPPSVGVAVNVTCSPGHIVVAEAEMEMSALPVGKMLAVIGLESAGDPETQSKPDVIKHVTTSPSESVPVINVSLSVPSLTPFTFHW
jgi:hypothetical protein